MLRNGGLTANAQLTGDPTHTLTLRRAYAAQMTKRFRALKGVIRQSIIDNDCFGIRTTGPQTNAPPAGDSAEAIKGKFNPIPARRFDFTRTSDKVEGFMGWLDEQQKKGILEVSEGPQPGRAIEDHWQSKYIRSSYQKGILRARQEMTNAGYSIPDIDEVEGGINAVFNRPFHADRVGAIYTRAFNELKGITQAMDQQISRELAEGMARGDGPEAMARRINDRVDKVGLTRARTLSRTETIRAHHVATIQEYENAGVEGVKIKAEWATAGDTRVCPLCAPLEGQYFELRTIRGMIPRHPNCRCVALPVDREEVEEAAPAQGEPPWDKVRREVNNDPVASRFSSLQAGNDFLKAKQSSREFFDQYSDEDLNLFRQYNNESARYLSEKAPFTPAQMDRVEELQQQFAEELKNKTGYSFRALRDWQSSTQKIRAMSLKRAASTAEKKTGKMVYPDNWDEDQIKRVKTGSPPKDDYIKLRAFNQAYMERLGIDKEDLYRGIDGPEGKKIARDIKEAKSGQMRRQRWPVSESPLSGFTTNKRIAEKFGKNSDGITYKLEVPKEEIVVHRDLFQGVTGRFFDEQEFIITGGKRKIDLPQIEVKE